MCRKRNRQGVGHWPTPFFRNFPKKEWRNGHE
nr:MAG TPA: hypothetical protein [Caudoviricetes sp.]